MILVADASFAAKVLLREDGTDIAQRWWDDDEVSWVSPALVAPEVEAALHAHHRVHPRRFDGRAREAASTRWAEMLAMIALHAVDRALASAAIALVRAHGPLRGADACYLAVARSLAQQAPGQVLLGSFDAQQRRAAASASLPLAPATSDGPPRSSDAGTDDGVNFDDPTARSHEECPEGRDGGSRPGGPDGSGDRPTEHTPTEDRADTSTEAPDITSL